MIKKRKNFIDAAFYYGLIFGGRKCLHAMSQKGALSHAISLAVNYRLFLHSDVSFRFNGKNEKVVLEYCINSTKHCKNEENIGVLYFITSSQFHTRLRYA